MCGIAQYLAFPAIATLVVIATLGLPKHLRFVCRLNACISNQELMRRGEMDGEGGLAPRFLFQRKYRELGDSELNALGEKYRTYLMWSLPTTIALIAIIGVAFSRGTFSSVLSCYGL
jgi:hypothetical protein